MLGTDTAKSNWQSAEAVIACEARRRDAMLAGDAERLSGMICDSAIYGHSTGHTDTKDFYIAKIAGGLNIYRHLELEAVSAQVFSDTAVVRGTMKGIVGVADRDIAIDNLFLTVWRRGSDGWRLVAHQTVAVG